MSRTFVLLVALHAYIGARLLPDLGLGTAGVAVGALILAGFALCIPRGLRTRSVGAGRRAR